MTNTTTRNVVLKTIHNDILTANPNSTLTTKMMRAKLRTLSRFDHVRNTSWVFDADDADDCRALFDDEFAAKLERRRARARRNTNAKTRKSKSKTTEPATTEQVDA